MEEGEVEERKKGRKKAKRMLGLGVGYREQSQVCMDPLIPVQVSRPLKMQSLLPLSSHLCFTFAAVA